MAEGYFTDGTIDVELGRHVFGLPVVNRAVIIRPQIYAPSRVHASGGGIQDIGIIGGRVRANLGDAERYAYELLADLAVADPGCLGYEDNRGHRQVWGDAICTGARSEVSGYAYVETTFSFISPEKSVEPGWNGVPATPGTYPGTMTEQIYLANGVNLGLGGMMSLELTRPWQARAIPRARGARVTVPSSGAVIRFHVTATQVGWVENAARTVEDLSRELGPNPFPLTANGNAFYGVSLEGLSAQETDEKAVQVQYTFVQDISLYGALRHTTSTTAAP